jgi:hypothetical protein
MEGVRDCGSHSWDRRWVKVMGRCALAACNLEDWTVFIS